MAGGITILVSFVTLISFVKVLRYAFLGSLPEELKKVRDAPALMGASLVILAVLCVGMGLLLVPGLRAAILDPAVEALAGEGNLSSGGLGQSQDGAQQGRLP